MGPQGGRRRRASTWAVPSFVTRSRADRAVANWFRDVWKICRLRPASSVRPTTSCSTARWNCPSGPVSCSRIPSSSRASLRFRTERTSSLACCLTSRRAGRDPGKRRSSAHRKKRSPSRMRASRASTSNFRSGEVATPNARSSCRSSARVGSFGAFRIRVRRVGSTRNRRGWQSASSGLGTDPTTRATRDRTRRPYRFHRSGLSKLILRGRRPKRTVSTPPWGAPQGGRSVLAFRATRYRAMTSATKTRSLGRVVSCKGAVPARWA